MHAFGLHLRILSLLSFRQRAHRHPSFPPLRPNIHTYIHTHDTHTHTHTYKHTYRHTCKHIHTHTHTHTHILTDTDTQHLKDQHAQDHLPLPFQPVPRRLKARPAPLSSFLRSSSTPTLAGSRLAAAAPPSCPCHSSLSFPQPLPLPWRRNTGQARGKDEEGVLVCVCACECVCVRKVESEGVCEGVEGNCSLQSPQSLSVNSSPSEFLTIILSFSVLHCIIIIITHTHTHTHTHSLSLSQ